MRPNTVLLVRCRENGLENVITLVKGKAEEVTLPVDKVNYDKILYTCQEFSM